MEDKPKRNFKIKPLTVDEMKSGKGEGRDWKTYPLTVSEINGWTAEKKRRNLEWQRSMADKIRKRN